MRCEQILPYLPGHVGGDLRSDTLAVVDDHLLTCASCRAESARAKRVVSGLALLADRDLEPPAFLLDAILEQHAEPIALKTRMVPVLPMAASDIPRLVAEHRDTIASLGATAIVAAGAAYALYRAVRSSRSGVPRPSEA